jgi:hypothetical protein
MNNHAATYNPSGKPGARGKGAIGQTTNLQAKAMRMCRERGGDSPLGSLSPPLPPPPPPPASLQSPRVCLTGRRGRRRGSQRSGERAMKPMWVGTGTKMRVVGSGGDSPLEILMSAQLLDGERSASRQRGIHCASLRRRALKRRRRRSGESGNRSGN